MVYGHHHDFVNNYRWPWICSVCLSRTMSFFSLSNISQSLSWLIIAFFRRENTASTVPPMDQELHTCRAPDFAHVFSGACVVHFVQVHAFTYFIMYIYVHLCTYSSVQHDFNTSIKWLWFFFLQNNICSFLKQYICSYLATRYNIMWWHLSVTCDRSVSLSVYSGFLHQ
jgi:hypothetical protein